MTAAARSPARPRTARPYLTVAGRRIYLRGAPTTEGHQPIVDGIAPECEECRGPVDYTLTYKPVLGVFRCDCGRLYRLGTDYT